jgi:hypothetical protein
MVGLVYTATEGQVGVSDRWGKSCLGVMTAFGLNLMYVDPSTQLRCGTNTPSYGFPMERVHKFQHALRRSWWTAHLFLL